MTIAKRRCVHCEKEFTPTNNVQSFCTEKCRSKLGYKKYKVRKQAEKEESDSKKGMFRFEDYNDNIII